MTRLQEYRAIERRHPGWRIWESDAAHPWATHVDHNGGVTLECFSAVRAEQVIAEWEHGRHPAAIHHSQIGAAA